VANKSEEVAMSDVSRRLQKLLGGRTAREVAERTGVHPETVRRYMGGMTPSVEFVAAICREFGVSGDWLLLDRGNMYPSSEAASLEQITQPALFAEVLARIQRLKDQLPVVESFVRDQMGTTANR
jgi:transcriptional regulator with XRE-family HTH domain